MKVEQGEVKQFKPITITLETEDELSQFYAVCNTIEICNKIPLMKKIHENLMLSLGYNTRKLSRCEDYFEDIRKLIK